MEKNDNPHYECGWQTNLIGGMCGLVSLVVILGFILFIIRSRDQIARDADPFSAIAYNVRKAQRRVALKRKFSRLPWINKIKPENRVPENLQRHEKEYHKEKKPEVVTAGGTQSPSNNEEANPSTISKLEEAIPDRADMNCGETHLEAV
ncbi:unnamed protein product [Penicillium bialowiezense]